MAKRLLTWVLVESILKVSQKLEDPKATAEILAEFDLTKLYPDFAKFGDVQKQVIVYGVKQKLADVGASNIADVNGKVIEAKKTWDELLAGKWKGERVNASAAAETKKLVADLKKEAEVVSLTGLILKQRLTPDKFTPEDQVKLDEFLALAAKGAKGKNGK